MKMKCPACGKNASSVFKCDLCGDVRCNTITTGGCASSSGKNQGGGVGRRCWACKKGKYKKI